MSTVRRYSYRLQIQMATHSSIHHCRPLTDEREGRRKSQEREGHSKKGERGMRSGGGRIKIEIKKRKKKVNETELQREDQRGSVKCVSLSPLDDRLSAPLSVSLFG